MGKYLICFQVAQLLSGTIEVEAPSAEAASDGFYRGHYDDARLTAKLELDDSEDAVMKVVGISGCAGSCHQKQSA